MTFRGATEDEVVAAIREAEWSAAPFGRFECRREYAYGRDWNGRHYGTKQVRPVFAEEQDAIVVVTVDVYYLP